LWDTNSLILNSAIINTYLKICHGFILICNKSDLQSLKVLEKQMENIINFSPAPKNILLFLNNKNQKNVDEKEHDIELEEKFMKEFNTFIEKFDIRAVISFQTVINEMSVVGNTTFDNFLTNVIRTKKNRITFKKTIINGEEDNSTLMLKTLSKQKMSSDNIKSSSTNLTELFNRLIEKSM